MQNRRPILMVMALLALAAWGFPPGGNAQAQSAENDPAECAGQILADDAYQKELIRDPLPPDQKKKKSDDGERSPALDDSPSEYGPRLSASRGLGHLFQILLYALAAVGALLALCWIVDSVRRRRADRNLPAAAGGVKKGGGSKSPIAGLGAIEKLAAEGLYAAAVHAMLLAVLRHLGRAAGSRPAPSLTSRELIELLPRTDREKSSLNRLVTTVEISLFGGRPVGADEYNDCLLSFRELSP